MPSPPRNTADRAAALLASWFGAGYVSRAPGTCGSLAAIPVALLVYAGAGVRGLIAAALFIFVVGWIVCEYCGRRETEADPQWIVIDEVAAVFLVLAFAGSYWPAWLAGFAGFRLFDITKPFPASWADRHVSGGLGIMLDDTFAAIYAAALTWAVSHYLPRIVAA